MTLSAFHWKKNRMECDWSDFHRSSKASMASSASVIKKRQEGQDMGSIPGLSSRGDQMIDAYRQKGNHGGAYSKAKKR